MLGLAAGDALGTTLEFTPPGRGGKPPLTDMVGGGPFRLQPGQWTDDTSMALCLADSLLTRGGWDAYDCMDRWLAWMTNGLWSSNGVCFDVGCATRRALNDYAMTRNPWQGEPTGGGNGPLMRLAPAVLWNPAESNHLAREQCLTTHGSPQAVAACGWFAALLTSALGGASKDAVLAIPCQSSSHPEVRAVAAGRYRKGPPTVRGSGYIVHTLEAALWAFWSTSSFRAGALAAVNLGEDADTVGAVYGQLAGAFYGVNGVTRAWRRRLTMRREIEDLADRLYARAMG